MARTRLTLQTLTGLGCLGIGLATPTALGTLPGVTQGPSHGTSAAGHMLQGAARSALDVVSSIQASLTPAKLQPAAPFALAYAPEALGRPPGGLEPYVEARPVPLLDSAGLGPVLALYRSGELAEGDEAARTLADPMARETAEWAALRWQPRAAGFDRLRRFMTEHPDWVGNTFLGRRAEEVLFAEKRAPAVVLGFFGSRTPETVWGKLALARAHQAEGRAEAANALARDAWRNGDLPSGLEAMIRRDFADALGKADHKFRSDRAFYKEQTSVSLRFAAYGGTDLTALAKAREALSDKAVAALPPDLRQDPTLTFARIQKLRRANKVDEAAQLMLTAPRDVASLVSPDDWWVERRLIARKLLDKGDAALAYRIASEHAAEGNEARMEAEFHAGWIALRFLSDPAKAAPHFETCARIASSPISIARAAYWQGRTAEAAGKAETAHTFYAAAAAQSSSYYGQLARTKLGVTELPVRMPRAIAQGDARDEAVRAVELLLAADVKDLASSLALEAARHLDAEPQLAALADVVAAARDPRATLQIGKAASQRGFALDEVAFPTFGVPAYEPLARSAPLQVVYAIARQESAFEARAASGAGAKGLMQMLPSTARRTAQNAGVPFDEGRLISDAAFNAQLGAAHLGELLGEQRGSLILTFAAYNAGGRRVKDWIAAYGDPRDASVDPIDWVERIPFTETRNYVQRVVENLEMYRARFGQRGGFDTVRTLRTADAKP